MNSPHSHQDRASEAASYAGQLQADLSNLGGMLNHYKDGDGVAGLEDLRDRGLVARRQLAEIAQRLGKLGAFADPGRYPLSDQEHAALDSACNLRETMMDTLERLQAFATKRG